MSIDYREAIVDFKRDCKVKNLSEDSIQRYGSIVTMSGQGMYMMRESLPGAFLGEYEGGL